MNVRTLLLTPLRCGQRSLRWLGLVIMVLCVAGAVIFGLAASRPDWPTASATILCFGLVYLWAFHFSSAFLLALDARMLRVPGAGRAVVASLLLYAVLCVVPPTLVLGAFGGHMAGIATLLALSIVGSLAFALLPRYIAMWFGFFPAINLALRHYLTVPGPDTPLFTHWAVPTAFVLLLIVVVRWRALLHTDRSHQQGMRGPLVMQYRRTGMWGALDSDCSGSAGQLRSRPDWMQAGADLRKVGPRQPGHTLRVALGGWYVPRTLAGHLRSNGLTLISILLFIPVMMLIFASDHHSADLWQGFAIGIIGWIGVFGAFMLFNIGTYLLRRHWSRVNAELPLLALLPGLGAREGIKRDLLRASLGLPMAGLALLLLLTLAAAWLLHIHGPGLMAVAMSQIGSAAAVVAMALDVLGGRPLSLWITRVLSFVLLALVALSVFLPLTSLGRHPMAHAHTLIDATLAAWMLFGLVLAYLGQRGWKAFAARAHAFLPLAPTAV